MTERIMQPQPTALMMAVGQPNIKGFASPSITPSNNYSNHHPAAQRAGYHQQSNNMKANQHYGKDASFQGLTNEGTGSASLRQSSNTGGGSSYIQGRRIDSPELKVSMNRDFHNEMPNQRPHTAGHPMFLQQQQQQHQQHGFMTIVSQQPYSKMGSAQHSGNTTTISHHQHGAMRRSGNPPFELVNMAAKQRTNNTIQYDGVEGKRGKASKSTTHQQPKKKKQQPSRSLPKYNSAVVNGIVAGGGNIVTAPHHNVINIQVQNTKAAPASKMTHQIPLRKRPDPSKFHSQGGQMSAPTKSKSRSRSQKRKNEPSTKPVSKSGNQSMLIPKSTTNNGAPLRHQANKQSLNKSNNYKQDKSGADMAFSFENKENQSLNFEEFSPSRITDGGRSGGAGANRKKVSNLNGITNFLDSDSSLSSPKPGHNLGNHSETITGGPPTGKSYYKEKNSFLKHLSPDRQGVHHQKQSSTIEQNHHQVASSGERVGSNHRVDSAGRGGSNSIKQFNHGATNAHKINLKVVDKMLKEKFKNMKAKEEAEENTRRKNQEEQLLQKHILLKKAEILQANSQRGSQPEARKFKVANTKQNQKSGLNSGAQLNIQRVNAAYKKQRSKSCMNKTDNIFGGLPHSKERQKIIQQAQIPLSSEQPNQDPSPQQTHAAPSHQRLVKRREKSTVFEMKELKRQCLEELKRDLIAGKIEGLPNNSSAAFASNKRPSNLTAMPQNQKDSKLNNSLNQQSKGDLVNTSKNLTAKPKENISNQINTSSATLLNPQLTSKIKKFMERKKKLIYIPKSLEQTILNEKKSKIQENLDNLFKNIKSKQTTHLRQQSYNFLLKRQQALQQPAAAVSNNTTSNIMQNESANTQPQKKLRTQFFNKKQSTKGTTALIPDGNRSSSLTPVRNSRKSRERDNDISIDCQEDYQKLINQIHNRHLIKQGAQPKGAYISNSNPPVKNRRRETSAQNDTLSIDASLNNKRDSSLKQEMTRKIHSKGFGSGSPLKNKKLIDELEQRQQRDHRVPARTIDISSSPSDRTKRRSSSSPNTIQMQNVVVQTIIPPHSDITTLAADRGVPEFVNQRGSTEQKRGFYGRSDEGSNSNQMSLQGYEYRERVFNKITKEYAPSVRKLHSQQFGEGTGPRLSNANIKAKLHHAAVIIQSHFRNLLKLKGFYEEQSNRYINSEDEEQEIQTEVKQLPAQTLIAQMSPLRFKPIKTNNNEMGSQFYAPNTGNLEKVVVCSVITSARNDPASEQAQTSNMNSLKTTQNYIPLRYRQPNSQEIQQPISADSSIPTSGFNTAIKTNPVQEEVKQEQAKSTSPVPTQQQVKLNESTPQDSSSRKNIVPSLNLKSLQTQPDKKSTSSQEEHKGGDSSRGKWLFDRHSFQEFQEQHQLQDFNLEMYPEMLQLRENAIQMREKTEKKLLKQMYHSNQVSPRTYEKKRKDLEIWVTKEQEEVKRTRKVFEQEWLKTQNIIALTQKNQENMKKLIGEQASSTHRSKHLESLHQGEDQLHSSRPRGDSHRVHSSRPEHKSYLDSLLDGKNEEPTVQQSVQIESSTKSKQSNFENNRSIETPPEVQQVVAPVVKIEPTQIPKIVVIDQSHYEIVKEQQEEASRKLKQLQKEELLLKQQADREEARRKIEDLQILNDHFRNEEIDMDSERLNIKPYSSGQDSGKIKEVDEMSEEIGGFNNDSGIHKVLSRTKNSLQLHTLNKEDEEDEEEEEEIMHQSLEKMQHHHNEEIREEDLINSDFRRNILDQSADGEHNQEVLPIMQSPNLQEHIHRHNFFIENFDLGTPQGIVDQIKHPRFSPTHEIAAVDKQNIEFDEDEYSSDPDHSKHSSIEKPPMPPSPSPEHKRSTQYEHPTELDEIDIDIPISSNELSNAPVSPQSQMSDTLVSAPGGVQDSRIITGGGSLNSTLSAGDGGNQDLIRVIHDLQHENNNKLSPPADSQEKLIDQITEDVYSKLLEDLKIDMELLLLSDPRVNNIIRPDNQNNRNQNLSESGRFLIFDRRGIQTDLFAIERYVEEVLQEVLLDKDRFLHNIMEAISRNSREVLNQLQNSEIGSYEHFEQHYPPVLPLDTYLKLERRRKDQRNAQQQENNSDLQSTQALETRNFLAECEHIHNKVLFDCINDSLLQFKPYGKDGSPLPWSRQNRRLKPIEDFTIEEMFEIVKHDLFRWAIMQAGTLPRREFVFHGQFDEELFAEIREKKLATLLAREMIENEPKWLNYQFEEAQVKIDIGDMILEQLVTETITILNERMIGNDNTSNFTSRMLL